MDTCMTELYNDNLWIILLISVCKLKTSTYAYSKFIFLFQTSQLSQIWEQALHEGQAFLILFWAKRRSVQAVYSLFTNSFFYCVTYIAFCHQRLNRKGPFHYGYCHTWEEKG